MTDITIPFNSSWFVLLFFVGFFCFSLRCHILPAERVAIKIIEKTGMDERSIRMLSREIANMDTVRHPAIVRCGLYLQHLYTYLIYTQTTCTHA